MKKSRCQIERKNELKPDEMKASPNTRSPRKLGIDFISFKSLYFIHTLSVHIILSQGNAPDSVIGI